MADQIPGPLLAKIHSPQDVQALAAEDLPRLAQDIRDELISVLSKTGGHLGPNLGVVELTIALHRVFNTPKDKFLFDVSHQGYVHKLLTGRLDRFPTIRQYEGLNGFLLRSESEHDCYGAGHAGTALSAALGMAAARDHDADEIARGDPQPLADGSRQGLVRMMERQGQFGDAEHGAALHSDSTECQSLMRRVVICA